jgi:hypothetical protein
LAGSLLPADLIKEVDLFSIDRAFWAAPRVWRECERWRSSPPLLFLRRASLAGLNLVSRAPGGQAYENDFAFRHVFDN